MMRKGTAIVIIVLLAVLVAATALQLSMVSR